MLRRVLAALLMAVACVLSPGGPLANAGTTTDTASAHVYDVPAVTRFHVPDLSAITAISTQLSDALEGSALPSVESRSTSTTHGLTFVATNSGSRGLSNLGGIIEETGTNAAGGRIFTSTGAISQNDFRGLVQAGLMRGDDVHILTGAHGLPNGSIVVDAGLLADDVRAFGSLPGVHIYDLPSMTPAGVQAVLNGPGTIIGGFCDSGACLRPGG